MAVYWYYMKSVGVVLSLMTFLLYIAAQVRIYSRHSSHSNQAVTQLDRKAGSLLLSPTVSVSRVNKSLTLTQSLSQSVSHLGSNRLFLHPDM